jgi:hypothetical protein
MADTLISPWRDIGLGLAFDLLLCRECPRGKGGGGICSPDFDRGRSEGGVGAGRERS